MAIDEAEIFEGWFYQLSSGWPVEVLYATIEKVNGVAVVDRVGARICRKNGAPRPTMPTVEFTHRDFALMVDSIYKEKL